MADLYCLGEPLIEFNQQADGRYIRGFGGDVSNVAIAAARQGGSAAMLTRVGRDRFGDELRHLWQAEAVNDEYVLTSAAGETGLYFVTHDEQGHHFTYRRRNSAASQFTVDDLPMETLASARVFYASGISLAISENMREAVFAGFEIVKRSGGLCAFDPNLRTALWPLVEAREVTHEIMKRCDIALPGFDDAKHLTGIEDPEGIITCYHDLGASVVALTMGNAGVIVSDRLNSYKISPLQVEAVDATGAGDCFNGAFLAAILRGLSPVQAARWANASAALSTCGYGAVTPIPTLTQTQAFLTRAG